MTKSVALFDGSDQDVYRHLMERFEEMYDRLLAAVHTDSSDDHTGPLDATDLWLYALMLAKDHVPEFGLFYPAFSDYVDKYTNVRGMAPSEILDMIEEIGNPEKPLAERMALSKPCIYLAPYLSMSNCMKVVSRTVEIVDQLARESGELPTEYLLEFSNFVSAESPEQIQREIYEYFKETIKGEFECAGLAVFAEVSSDFLDSKDHSGEIREFLRKRCLKTLEDEDAADLVKMAACYCMEVQGEVLEFSPEESFGALRPYLMCENEKLRQRANKAARMFAAECLWDDEILKEFLGTFKSYPSEQSENFLKLASMFITDDSSDEYEEEEENEEQINCARELTSFVEAQFKQKPDTMMTAMLLDLGGVCGQKSYDVIREHVTGWLNRAKDVAASDVVTAFSYVGYFLSVVAADPTPEQEALIWDIVPMLARACFDESVSPKRQLLLASDLAYTLTNPQAPKDQIPALFNLAATTLEGKHLKNAMRACGLIMAMKDDLTVEQAQRGFNALINWIIETKDPDQAHLLVEVAKKLVKRYDISYESCERFTNGIIDGSLVAFQGVKPWLAVVQPEFHFELLCKIIKKFPAAAPVALQVWSWAKDANTWALLPILDVVHTAIVFERVDKSKFFDMAHMVLTRIKKANLSNVDLICSCTNVLAAIYKADKTILAHPEDYIEPFGRIIDLLVENERLHQEHHLQHQHGEEEDDDECDETCESLEHEMHIVPPVVRFALDVYSTDASVDINQDLFLKLFMFMPFSDEEGMAAVVEAINEIIGEDRFTFARKSVATLYMRLFILGDESLYFEEDTQASMKAVIKNAIAEFPGFEQILVVACGQAGPQATQFIQSLQ